MHVLGSKTDDLGSKLARKHPKAGLESTQDWHEKQRVDHYGYVKFCSNTTENIIKLKKKQIKCLKSEYMIYGIGALHSLRRQL